MPGRFATIRKSLIAAALAWAACLCAVEAKTIYVDDDANAPGDGKTWATAYKYLQDALADANSADKPVEVRIAAGLYLPDRTAAEPNGTGDTPSHPATFDLSDGLTIAGGYAGLKASDPNIRNTALYETILSGDLAGNDVDPSNPDYSQSQDDNCQYVVAAVEPNAAWLVDGITVTGANYPGYALYCISQAQGNIVDCVFRDNAELAVFGHKSSLFIRASTFERNAREAVHSVSWANNSTILSIEGCSFRHSHSAVGSDAHTVKMTGCLVEDITATAVYLSCSDNGHVTIEHCIIRNNTCSISGIDILPFTGRVGPGSLNITDCVLTGNSGHNIINVDAPGMHLKNCLVAGNIARIGPCVYLGWGGQVENCTFADNVAAESQYVLSLNDTSVTNSIVWGDNPQQIDGTNLSITNSDIPGGWPGAGNIDIDPCFADPGHWDDSGTPDDANDDVWVDGDYHLKSRAGRWLTDEGRWTTDDVTSPCIDTGDPMSPIGLEPFPNGGRLNMGAYGGTAEASKSYFGDPVCRTIIAGDINGDCRVDFADFAITALHWMQTADAQDNTGSGGGDR